MEKDIAAFDRSITRSGASSRLAETHFTRAMNAGSKWGSQMQWTGRQIHYNFGIPLAIAGGAAVKFALDNERAMTRVIKVYGDGTEAMNDLSKTEIPALERAFVALSNQFGVAQADAINIAADWAAAGASGLALAKSVKLTMETMILGELEAAEATQALIAIQAQYGQSTADLAKTIDVLNMVENQTGISMQGLVQGFARAAGVARSAGVDVRHLAAMLAALVPAAGTAANAGNALKTMISRVLAPTGEASDILQLMGIRTAELGWKSLNASQRLEILARKFDGLSDAQKAVVSSTIASRYQINRFDVLMRDIINENGYYQKSLRATGDELANYRQRVKELNAVLESNPQKMKQIKVVIQNTMASAIQPLIPLIVYLGQQFALLGQKIAETNPAYLKLAGAFLALLLVFGMATRVIGASILLFFTLTRVVHAALKPVLFLARGIWILAAAPFGILGTMVGALVGALLFLPGAIFTAAGALVGAMPKILAAMVAGFKAMIVLTRIMALSTMAIMGGLWPALMVITSMGGKALVVLWRGITMAFGAQALAMRAVLIPIWMGTFLAMGTGLAAIGREFMILWRAITWSFGIVWITFTVGFMKIYRGFLISMAVGMRVAAVELPKIWAAMWWAMTYIMQTAGRTLLATWLITMNMMRTIMFTAGATMAAGWLAIQMVMQGAAFAMGFIAAGMVFAIRTVVMAPATLVPIFAKAWTLLLGIMRGGLMGMVIMSRAFLAALASPWVLLALVILGAIYALRDRLRGAWEALLAGAQNAVQSFAGLWSGIGNFFGGIVNGIVTAFNRLPKGVRDAFMAVVRIVHSAAMAVYDLFSYFNPFARHSPSLVDNVTAGMGNVTRQYAKMATSTGSILAKAKRDLEAYKKVAGGLGIDTSKFADERADVSKAFPSALPIFDTLVGDLAGLNAELTKWDSKVKAQEGVVAGWKDKLDAANTSVDAQREKLSDLQDELQGLKDKYDAHQTSLEKYASAPLKGMGAMSDKIFENEMAQKRLRLEMMKYEDANGSIDSVRKRLALLQGDIESGHSEVNELRLAGAGSDITGPLLAQVTAMEKQRDALENSGDPKKMKDMEDELERLRRAGERLDLENSIKFDPMIREIEKLANATKELSYDEIVAGINRERAAMEALKPQIDAATEAVKAQEGALKSAEDTRDAIQKTYDEESAKLDKLKDSYDAVADAITSVEDALRDLGGAASTKIQLEEAAKAAKEGPAGEKPSPAAQNFMDAEGGNFPEVGGFAQIGREGGMGDQSALIDEFTAGIAADTAAMFGEFDMFGPIKDMWNSTWTWIKDNIGPFVTPIWNALKDAFTKDNIFGGAGKAGGWFKDTFGPVGGWFGTMWEGIKTGASSMWSGIKAVWGFFAEDFKKIWGAVLDGFKIAWSELGPAVSAFFPLIMPLLQALWNIVKIVAAVVGGALLLAFKMLSSILAETLGPVLDFIITSFANFLDFVRGAAMILIGIFTGDFGMIKDGAITMFQAMWDQIKNIFETVPAILWGLVSGFFKGMWDILKLGGDAVVLVIKGMWGLVQDLFEAAYKSLPGPVQSLVDVVIGIFKFLWNTVESIFKAMWAVVKFLFDNVAKPIFDLMIATMKAVGAAFEWVYNNVLKPVLGFIGDRLKDLGAVFKWVWENVVKPVWDLWWGTVKRVWETVGLVLLIAIVGAVKVMAAIFGWVWDNVIKPAWDKFTGGLKAGWKFGQEVLTGIAVALDVLGQVFEDIWDVIIKPAWNRLVEGLKTAWNATGKPVIDGITGVLTSLGTFFSKFWEEKVKPGWNSFLTGMQNLWDRIGKPMINGVIGGINAAIGAINGLFNGLNSVGDKLGIGLKITLIPTLPKFAEGGQLPGRKVGSGFRTNGARAIVGEGNSNHPEYVIPTDPRFRTRALSLMGSLGQELGGVPAFARGGKLPTYPTDNRRLLAQQDQFTSRSQMMRKMTQDKSDETGGPTDWASGAWNAAKGGASKVGDVANAAAGLFRGALAKGFQPFLNASNGLIEKIPVKIIREIIKKARDKFTGWVAGKDAALPKEGVAGNGAIPGAGWSAIVNWLRAAAPGLGYRVTSTYRAGDDGYHGSGRAVDLAGPRPGVDTPELLAINRALLPVAGTLRELIYSGPGGQSFKNGRSHPYSADVRAIHHNHVHAALAKGGITTGPTTALIGEAGAEAVVPLTKFWQKLTEGFMGVVNALNTNHYATLTRLVAIESFLTLKDTERTLREHAFETAAIARDEALKALILEQSTALITFLTEQLPAGFASVTAAVADGANAIGQNIASAIAELGGMIDAVRSLATEAMNMAKAAQETANAAVAAAAAASAAAASAAAAAEAAKSNAKPKPGATFTNDWRNVPSKPSPWKGALVPKNPINWATHKFATGGIVTGATQGIVGEAGPEAIIPLGVFWKHLDDGFRMVTNATNTVAYTEVQLLVAIENAVDRVAAGTRGIVDELPAGIMAVLAPAIDEAFLTANGISSAGFATVTDAVKGLSTTVKDAAASAPAPAPVSSGGGGGGFGGGNPTTSDWNFGKTFSQAMAETGLKENPDANGTISQDWLDMQAKLLAQTTYVQEENGTMHAIVGTVNYKTAPKLAKGGIVKARTGGTVVRVGEAGEDEAVVPLSRIESTRNNSGGRTVNLYGNLVLPNIRSGEDADELIRNLESLAD